MIQYETYFSREVTLLNHKLRFLRPLAALLLIFCVGSAGKAESASRLLDDEVKNPDYILKEAHAIKLAWMCAALRDFPQNFQQELTLSKSPENHFVFHIPADLGIDRAHIWLLANEISRLGLKELAGGLFVQFPQAGSGEGAEQSKAKASEFAELLKTELRKRNISIVKITIQVDDKNDQANGLPESVLARAPLPSLAATFRKVLADEDTSSTAVSQVLIQAYRIQHLTSPKSQPTFRFLNDCVQSVIGNFQTAPEFLTLLPAIKVGSEWTRRLSGVTGENFFIINVASAHHGLKASLYASDTAPKSRAKFEAKFPALE